MQGKRKSHIKMYSQSNTKKGQVSLPWMFSQRNNPYCDLLESIFEQHKGKAIFSNSKQ